MGNVLIGSMLTEARVPEPFPVNTAAPSPHPELLLMLLADARLPTSGHTQSAGLEPALQGGLDPDDTVGYCRARLATVTLVDAATAVVARHRALHGLGTDVVEEAWEARTPSPALRVTAFALGRAYRRLALQVWPDAPALAEMGAVTRPSRARVVGLVAAATGLGAGQLARLIAYDDMQSVLSASLKLVPGDPVAATARLLDLAPDVERLVRRCADLREASDIPAASAPLIEAWAEAHASSTRRLFRG